MKVLLLATLLILSIVVVNCHEHPTKEDIQNELNSKTIYYGSAIRIRNQQTRHQQKYFSKQTNKLIYSNFIHSLYSMDVSYGSGSRGQVVTGTETDTEIGSLFTIKHGHNKPIQTFTNSVKCGDTVRLEHMNTRKNLQGANYSSPVSNKLEVSCAGNNGEGDGNDNFVIDCLNVSKGSDLVGKTEFYLQHLNTSQYLATNRRHTFNRSNCGFQCPIMDHLEVSCQRTKDNDTKWKIVGGVLLQKSQWSNDDKQSDPFGDDDEDDEEHYNAPSSSDSKKKENNTTDDDGYEEIIFNKREDL